MHTLTLKQIKSRLMNICNKRTRMQWKRTNDQMQ